MTSFWDVFLLALGAIHLAPVFAPLAYVRHERAYRANWQVVPLEQVVESSAYRSAGSVVVGHMERAPTVVRMAAASSFVLGSMFVPGLVWALFGLLAAGAGLLGIPGLVVAARLWGAGHALLAGLREGAVSAARAARFSLWFNVFLVLATSATLALAGEEEARYLAVFTLAYATLSIAQALLVLRAAYVVAALHDEDTKREVESGVPSFLRHLLRQKRLRGARAGRNHEPFAETRPAHEEC